MKRTRVSALTRIPLLVLLSTDRSHHQNSKNKKNNDSNTVYSSTVYCSMQYMQSCSAVLCSICSHAVSCELLSWCMLYELHDWLYCIELHTTECCMLLYYCIHWTQHSWSWSSHCSELMYVTACVLVVVMAECISSIYSSTVYSCTVYCSTMQCTMQYM